MTGSLSTSDASPEPIAARPMHRWQIMMKSFFAVVLACSTVGCATRSVTETTWAARPAPDELGRAGRVESVREVVQHVEGNPAGGALLGALIGGVLTRGRPIGVVGGAAVGAAASQGAYERRVYEVRVRFYDGVAARFRYYGFSPFAPGARVVLAPDGLHPM